MTKHIILNPDDLPTLPQMTHASFRLRKVAELLKKVKGTQDIDNPDAHLAVADFLDMLIKREAKSLKGDGEEIGPIVKSLEGMAVRYLATLPDEEILAKIHKLRSTFND